MTTEDAAFVGAIPDVYERLLVPMIFAEPARHLAAAVLASEPTDILETAAGTGVLTRALVDGGAKSITATDLNQPMLDVAAQRCPSSAVRWQVADALHLPMPDRSFDAVVCQFGAMFFPDKPRGYAEARRVLRGGGALWFSVWDRIEANPALRIVSDTINAASPQQPIDFIRRIPHGYFDADLIREHLQAAGYRSITIDTLTGTSESTALETATAVCQGTPLRMELQGHPTLGVDAATALATQALRDEYGDGTFRVPTSWLQVWASEQAPGPERSSAA
jgi:ubiquinone/menaquinone biosynthesis C-methylase UbiE